MAETSGDVVAAAIYPLACKREKSALSRTHSLFEYQLGTNISIEARDFLFITYSKARNTNMTRIVIKIWIPKDFKLSQPRKHSKSTDDDLRPDNEHLEQSKTTDFFRGEAKNK